MGGLSRGRPANRDAEQNTRHKRRQQARRRRGLRGVNADNNTIGIFDNDNAGDRSSRSGGRTRREKLGQCSE